MQQVDATAVAQGIDSFELMRQAGKAVSEAVIDLLMMPVVERCAGDASAALTSTAAETTVDRRWHVLVVAGPGNNGGDGAIAASELRARGYDVRVLRFVPDTAGSRQALGKQSQLSQQSLSRQPHGEFKGDAERAFSLWEGDSREVSLGNLTVNQACLQLIDDADIIIDALFGAGLSRPVAGMLATVVERINRSSARVVAVDVPSGLDGNTHCVDGTCVQADVTVTFFRYKPAHFLYPGRALCGRKILAQIGLSDAQLDTRWPECLLNQPDWFGPDFPTLSREGHKFDRGHLLVRSGPLSATGAARMSAQAALNCGAGLVSLASDGKALPVNAAHLTAVMLRRCDSTEQWQALLRDVRINTVLVGPGNGVDDDTREAVVAAVEAAKHCVLDADALSCWPTETDREALYGLLHGCPRKAVLTPHGGEFSRLFPRISRQVQSSRLHQSLAAARQSSAVIVYKGADTVIASPDGRSAINANAPPWLATAGAGDVLAGVIASLMAQGMAAFESACAAVWMHGEAAMQLGYPMTSERLLEQVPVVFKRLAEQYNLCPEQ